MNYNSVGTKHLTMGLLSSASSFDNLYVSYKIRKTQEKFVMKLHHMKIGTLTYKSTHLLKDFFKWYPACNCSYI